ncbi:hypothetical protein DSO57_1025154 [Entomophthora muscae]|uniref:Uncharacterized protein n=1 Tax=Entomophthora muscae TaxID=34485 RepID=A0ACC2SF75_9FUNG|nr:hypothetical protein DSO57_1025154 [Entomophthora muscae]
MDTRKQPSHIVELASTRLLYFVQLAECILDQNGATLYEVASKIDVIPTSRYFKDNKIWRQQFQDLPLHLKELLPLTLIVLSNVMQYLYPGLHARLDPVVGGIRMGKKTKVNMLLGIAMVAVHYPKLFPDRKPPQSIITFVCGFNPR